MTGTKKKRANFGGVGIDPPCGGSRCRGSSELLPPIVELALLI